MRTKPFAALATAALAAAALTACQTADGRTTGTGTTAGRGPAGDPGPRRLQPGEKPPQFVVFSWDGAGAGDDRQFPRFLELARKHRATMTFFLSGLYMLPESKRTLYRPPHRAPGSSAIPFLSDNGVRATIRLVDRAHRDGHEIGTHFNGHFCGPGGVGSWTVADWRSEIAQAGSFVRNWKANTGFTDLPDLSFDYDRELAGGRTPCLEGRPNLLRAAAKLGWKYDASSPGGLQVWPGKTRGVWNLPLQSLPYPGKRFGVLSMDYNIMANQPGNVRANPALQARYQREATNAYMAGFARAYNGNRAPLFIGNHFEQWNNGIYMNAVADALERMAARSDVRLVSFKQLVEWLDAQDPAVLAKLRTLGVGAAPAGGWKAFTSPRSQAAP
ncbi:hypothetical protein GCM10009678_32180 [Actinomadura kijaniata]|uniref:Peptidoglycan/xylan/chitin deacetylase (PgdA/CDA1 family) n=1 Tax=Actinomadura namibiensis TaxID=182080 RepID=A0A7W3QIS5_ACTNM|nr:hypothetical protein [Actinomadura namibiensis]MBA8948641.1 peptidoglycan/xylan/chitin deacetylase (PgdA/CDA1 family) [Actinomadura namibiensis]